MPFATSTLRHCALASAAMALALALAMPQAIEAQSAAPAPAPKTEKAAKPDTHVDTVAEKPGAEKTGADKPGSAKSIAAKRQKLRDCGIKWQEEKKAKGLSGRAAYLKFIAACMKS